MATKTLEQQLESVQAAIAKIESGAQTYGIAGRSVERADLSALYRREKELKAALVRQKRGSSYGYMLHS